MASPTVATSEKEARDKNASPLAAGQRLPSCITHTTGLDADLNMAPLGWGGAGGAGGAAATWKRKSVLLSARAERS